VVKRCNGNPRVYLLCLESEPRGVEFGSRACLKKLRSLAAEFLFWHVTIGRLADESCSKGGVVLRCASRGAHQVG
jgi:hypothetical protein